MQELEIRNVFEIKNQKTAEHIEFFTKQYKNSKIIQFIVFAIATLVFLWLIGPVLIAALIISIFGHFMGIVSIFSLMNGDLTTNFNIVEFVLFQLIFFFIDIIFAVVFVVFFFLLTATINQIKALVSKEPNKIQKIYICSNYLETKKATTVGIFGFFYSQFEQALKRLFLGDFLDSKMKEMYKNGSIVLKTKESNWPIMQSHPYGWNQRIKIVEENENYILLLNVQANLVAFGVINQNEYEIIKQKMENLNIKFENELEDKQV